MDTIDQPSKPKAPPWAWAFVAACGAIPAVALGGAIPGALGAAGAATCYGLARDGSGSVTRRVLSCSLVTLVAWAAYGGQFWFFTSGSGDGDRVVKSTGTKTTRTRIVNGEVVSVEEISYSPRKKKSADELNDDERREIYLDAIKRRTRIEEKEEQIEEREDEGRSARVLRKQLETLEKMHDRHIDFVASRHGFSRPEIEEIIEQGDWEGWD